MGWLGVKWAFGPKGERRGPFSKGEIINLIEAGVITPETRLSEYRSKREYRAKDDYPAIKTEFSVYFPREKFIEAASESQVPDYWMWTAVFTPLLVAVAAYSAYFTGLEARGLAAGAWCFSIAPMFMDGALFAQRGYKPPLRAIGYTFFFGPMVYFYCRSKQLMRKQTPAWISAACFLLIMWTAMQWPTLTNKDVEEISVRHFNAILKFTYPEGTVECESASVQERLPGMKFKVAGHLRGGQTMEMTLAQSWRSLVPDSNMGNTKITLPTDLGISFMEKYGERFGETAAGEVMVELNYDPAPAAGQAMDPAELYRLGNESRSGGDYAAAAEWYRKAAEQGHAGGQNSLGIMYANGRGVNKDDRRAVEWYRKAAAQGRAAAQNNLGWMYENGRGVNKDDRQAAEWYRKAAEQGHADGQNNLGRMYESGRGVDKNYRQAVEWYRKAADQGNAWGQNNLGLMYTNGRGVNKDDRQAAEWYRKAAEQGDAWGQNNLGWTYENGRGVRKDVRQAAEWYRKAAAQGNKNAQNALKRLKF